MTNNKTARKAADTVTKADERTTRKAAGKRDTPLVRVLGTLAEAADQPPLTVIALGTFAIGLATGRTDIARGGVRMLAAHALATAAKTAIKRRVDRARPAHAIETGDDRFEPGDTHEHALNSFPSGHTASAVAVARAIGRDVPAAAAPAALAAAAAGLIQLPTGNHYGSDVVAGAALGWASEAIVTAVFDRVEPRVTRAARNGMAALGQA